MTLSSIKNLTYVSFWLALLSGCATPVGQLKDSDLTWSHVEVGMNYQQVFRNVREGYRKCGLIAEGNLYTDIKEGNFDAYLTNITGGKDAFVSGMVRIKFKDDQSSNLSVGIINRYDDPLLGKKGKMRERILGWAIEKYDCS